MTSETPRRRVGAGLLTALGLCGICCSLIASCRPRYITLDFSAEGEGGSASAGSGEAAGGGSAGTGGSTSAGPCTGHTVCVQPSGDYGPYLVWWGTGPIPNAPDRATINYFLGGHGDLVAGGCEACACGPLQHTCSLPTSMTAYDTWPCPAGQPGQPFNAALGWDGKCDASNPIPAPSTVQSLLVGAIDLVESCAPIEAKPSKTPVEWGLNVAAFGGTYIPCGPHPYEMGGPRCAPTLSEPGDPPEGFHLCMMRPGSTTGDCYGDPVWSEPHVFYRQVKDTRECGDCTCTPPAARGLCTSVLSVYQDADTSCNGPLANAGQNISSEKPTCIDINPANQPLGSKSATAPQYTPALGEPGCQPGGGALTGSLLPSSEDSATFCCIP